MIKKTSMNYFKILRKPGVRFDKIINDRGHVFYGHVPEDTSQCWWFNDRVQDVLESLKLAAGELKKDYVTSKEVEQYYNTLSFFDKDKIFKTIYISELYRYGFLDRVLVYNPSKGPTDRHKFVLGYRFREKQDFIERDLKKAPKKLIDGKLVDQESYLTEKMPEPFRSRHLYWVYEGLKLANKKLQQEFVLPKQIREYTIVVLKEKNAPEKVAKALNYATLLNLLWERGFCKRFKKELGGFIYRYVQLDKIREPTREERKNDANIIKSDNFKDFTKDKKNQLPLPAVEEPIEQKAIEEIEKLSEEDAKELSKLRETLDSMVRFQSKGRLKVVEVNESRTVEEVMDLYNKIFDNYRDNLIAEGLRFNRES